MATIDRSSKHTINEVGIRVLSDMADLVNGVEDTSICVCKVVDFCCAVNNISFKCAERAFSASSCSSFI